MVDSIVKSVCDAGEVVGGGVLESKDWDVIVVVFTLECRGGFFVGGL